MGSTLEIDNKKMHSIKSATTLTSYSRDYITRLAREQKIVATQIGRQWFIDIDSLKNYEAVTALEQKIRQQHLSAKRKEERLLSEVVVQKTVARKESTRLWSVKSKVMALGVLMCGLGVGSALSQLSLVLPSLNQQVASAPVVQQLQDQNEVFVGAVKTISMVPGVSMETLDFTEESVRLETFGDVTNGVLILPDRVSPQGLDPKSLFSDEVTINTDALGETFIARVNQDTGVTEKIPFVVVPVSHSATP